MSVNWVFNGSGNVGSVDWADSANWTTGSGIPVPPVDGEVYIDSYVTADFSNVPLRFEGSLNLGDGAEVSLGGAILAATVTLNFGNLNTAILTGFTIENSAYPGNATNPYARLDFGVTEVIQVAHGVHICGTYTAFGGFNPDSLHSATGGSGGIVSMISVADGHWEALAINDEGPSSVDIYLDDTTTSVSICAATIQVHNIFPASPADMDSIPVNGSFVLDAGIFFMDAVSLRGPEGDTSVDFNSANQPDTSGTVTLPSYVEPAAYLYVLGFGSGGDTDPDTNLYLGRVAVVGASGGGAAPLANTATYQTLGLF